MNSMLILLQTNLSTVFVCLALSLLSGVLTTTASLGAELPNNPVLDKYIRQRVAEFEQIPQDRQAVLRQLARYIEQQQAAGKPAQLTFICTHNSRRSHLAQIWGAVAAAYYHINTVATYSGGTESTAFNSRAVAALQRAGFQIEATGEDSNPRYQVTSNPNSSPQVCYSKIYSAETNPQKNFCAVMTCSDADARCPIVPGAEQRIAIPYEDPKAADGTPAEAAAYDERCAQIAREMLFVCAQIKG